MIRQRKGRAIFGGTVTAGLILCVAGAAFACTKFYGELTGTGNHVDNMSTNVTGNPNSQDAFQWCEDPPPFQTGSPAVLTDDATREAYWGTKVNRSGAELTVSVAPADTCLQDLTIDSNKLPAGTYKVGMSEGYWDESTQGFATGDEDNCHSLENGNSGTNGYGTIIDTAFIVDSTGTGSETYNSTNGGLENTGILRDAVSGTGGWNTVCVYMPQGQSLDPNYFNPANALNFRSL